MVDISIGILIGLVPTAFFMGFFSEFGKDVYQWVKRRREKMKDKFRDISEDAYKKINNSFYNPVEINKVKSEKLRFLKR